MTVQAQEAIVEVVGTATDPVLRTKEAIVEVVATATAPVMRLQEAIIEVVWSEPTGSSNSSFFAYGASFGDSSFLPERSFYTNRSW